MDELIKEIFEGNSPEEGIKELLSMAEDDPKACHYLFLAVAKCQLPAYYPDVMRLLEAGLGREWPYMAFDLGTIYELGIMGQESQPLLAIKAYKIGVANHDPACSNALGRISIGGEIVEPNPQAAAYWYEKSYEDGNVNAALYLGNLYNPVNQCLNDIPLAAYWYEQGSKHHVADCCLMLGSFYEDEDIKEVPYDLKKAHELYEEAANLGSIGGCVLTGLGYLYGIGCPINKNMAIAYLRHAANAGDEEAIEALRKIAGENNRYGGNLAQAGTINEGYYSGISGVSYTGKASMERQAEERERQEAMKNQQLLQAAATANGLEGQMSSSGSYMMGLDNADLMIIGDSVYNTQTGDFMKYDSNAGLLWNFGQKDTSLIHEDGDAMFDYTGGNVSYRVGNTIVNLDSKK